MKNKESLDNLYLFIIVVAILVIDVQLSGFFSQNLNYQLSNVLFSDVLVVSIAGFLGKYLALKSGLPLWWRQDGSTLLSRRLAELFTLGLMIIIPNTLIYLLC